MKKIFSIRWKVLMYVLFFALGIFLLLWIFQTMFLNWFYENTRLTQVYDVADAVAINVDDRENLEEIMTSSSQNNDVCVRVFYSYGDEVNIEAEQGCAVSRLTSNETITILNNTITNGGSYLDKQYESITMNTLFGQVKKLSDENYDLMYSKLQRTADGYEALILVSARMTPVNATVTTLKQQLIYIGFILLFMSIILTYVITSRIVKPLEKMNKSAMVLSTGNYDVDFESSEYKEVHELSASLNYASSKLKELEQVRRDLLANVTHDLRTPLTMISGYGEMMRDIPEENNAQNAQVIIDESKRLSLLVNDLLDLSKLQSNTLNLSIEPFNISSLIEKTCTIYNQSLSDRNLTLEYDKGKDIEVMGDVLRIQQVLNNFINNALHYGNSEGKIIVRQIEKEDVVRIEVEDFGEGIASDKIEHIWDRYYKIDKTHVRSMNGSGIGLSIVKEILTLHGVDFGVSSKPQIGTTFYFELNKVKK